jgi:hypothetical protein
MFSLAYSWSRPAARRKDRAMTMLNLAVRAFNPVLAFRAFTPARKRHDRRPRPGSDRHLSGAWPKIGPSSRMRLFRHKYLRLVLTSGMASQYCISSRYGTAVAIPEFAPAESDTTARESLTGKKEVHMIRHRRYAGILLLRSVRAVAGAVAAGALLAAVLPAAQPASASSSQTLCRRYQHVAVQDGHGGHFWVRNDFWGTTGMCMASSGDKSNFTVVATRANRIHGQVMAYPYIFSGCSWGICTPGSGLPARASTLRDPESTWRTTAKVGGIWDASYDLWFDRNRMTNGQARGAELMIWINSSNIAPFTKRTVWIDHVAWYIDSWRTKHSGMPSWRYIQFRRVHPVSQVTNLRLGPFIRRAERLGYVQRQWWLLNIEAGFELTKGGAGLKTTYFTARS